jgi:hypothetical protein
MLSLLGAMPDRQLALRIGCSKESVIAKRKKLGIKAYSGAFGPGACNWGETELALIRNYSDKEIVKMMGRSLTEIAEKRKSLSSHANSQR